MAALTPSRNTTTFSNEYSGQSYEAIDQYFDCMAVCDRDDQDCPNACLIDYMNFNNG